MLSNRIWLAIHAAALTLAISPILIVENIPLMDLPNHIGRIFILKDIIHSPGLQKFYAYDWAFVPNLAFDLFGLVVGRAVGVMFAAKLFCLLAAGLLYIGTVLLHRALHGRFSVVPIAALGLVYNGAFLFGFVNYVLGVGLSLCAMAAWVEWRDVPRRIHIPLFTAIATGLIIVHIFGFGLFGVGVLGFEAHRVITAWRRSRSLASRAMLDSLLAGIFPAVVPVALFLFASPATSGLQRNIPSNVYRKIEALAGPELFYLTSGEIGAAVSFIAILLFALFTRIIVVNARCVIGLCLMLAVFLLMPRTLLSSGYADFRMPSAIALFFVASLDFGPRTGSRTLVPTMIGLLVAAAVKPVVIGAMWYSWQPALAAYRMAFAQLPRGAALLAVDGTTGSASLDRRPPIGHMPSLATEREAFVPRLYGDEPGFLLRFQADYFDLKHFTAMNGAEMLQHLDRYGSRYSHVLVNRPEFVQLPTQISFVPIASGPTFILYRIQPRS